MTQALLLACFVAVATAGRLENTYLPPGSASGAGGSHQFLNGPFKPASPSPFVAPSPFSKIGAGLAPSGPSGAYGPPVAHARSAEAGARIIHYDNNNDGLGNYAYQFDTENGIQVQESGQVKGGDSQSAHGSYKYTAPDGIAYAIQYLADENGFQVSGDHLPTAPPIPEAILKSLEQNAADEAAGIYNDGSGQDGQYHEQYHEQYQHTSPTRGYLAPSQPSHSQHPGYKY